MNHGGRSRVYYQHYLEDLSVSEVAYALDLPEGTVKSRLCYAREKLRKRLREERVERGEGTPSEIAYDLT